MGVMTANDGIGKIEVFDLGLQFALVLLGHFPTKDQSDLFGLSDGSVHVQQSLRELVHGGPTEKDQVVAILHLREKQSMLATGLLPFPGGEERSKSRQPLLSAGQQVLGR